MSAYYVQSTLQTLLEMEKKKKHTVLNFLHKMFPVQNYPYSIF